MKNLFKFIFKFICALSLLSSFSSFAQSSEQTAKARMQKFISEDLSSLSLPDGIHPRFYTLCDGFEGAFGVSIESADCVAFAVYSNGVINYQSAKLSAGKLGIAINISNRSNDLHRIKGVESLSEIDGFYLTLTSGIGAVETVRENWFTLKLTVSDFVGNSPEGDVSMGGAAVDFLSLGIIKYSINDLEKPGVMLLSKEQINSLK